MRPHRLRVTAFGAFAGSEQVVLDDLEGLFLLHGETGAGKTTLLDAIAFALYGRVPGERGSARRLRSDHAQPGTATEVELEATIGGRRLRVTRRPEQDRPKRSGAGLTREQASVRVEERAPDGTWTATSTRVGEADKEIADLMGMSAEQFFQVALLPQGQFARFLHASAQEKEALLQKLFGTDRFQRVEGWLADRRRATDKDVETARTELAALVARIAQAAGAPLPDPSKPSASADSPSAAPVSVAPVPTALVSAGAVSAGAVSVSLASAGTQGAALVSVNSPSANQALASPASPAWQQGWATALAATANIELDAAATLVAARKVDLETALAGRARADQLAERQRRRRDAIHQRQELEAATPEIVRLPAEPAALRAAAQQQQAQVGRLEALAILARQAEAEDDSAGTARARAASLADDLAQAIEVTRQRQDARLLTEQARATASQAAADLPAATTATDAAHRLATDLAAFLAEHARRSTLREARLTAGERSVAAQAQALRVRAARIDGMRAELAAAMTDGTPCPVCGSLDHPDPVDAATFPPVSRDEEETVFELARAAAEAANEAAQRVAAVSAVLDDLMKRLMAVGFAVLAADPGADPLGAPRTVAVDIDDLDIAALHVAAATATGDADRLDTEAARLAALAASLPDRQRELDDLDQALAFDSARTAELTEQRTAALAEAGAAAARAAARRDELAAQLDGTADLNSAIDAASSLADALTEAASVADLLADPDLNVELDPPAPVAETAEAAEAAQQAHDSASEAYGQARHRSGELAALLPQLHHALGALRPLQERAGQIRQLAELAEGRGANQYKMTLSSFVLAARLEEVAAAASERLLTMTSGRYRLVHSDAKKGNAKAGLSLLACDAWTGIDRDTATLSGGETFLASLSLALGLADVVRAESAGTPMEALFIDEGFGTLDEDTLDEVMNVLDGLRAGGRLVGIVSHVTELRQRIPARIHVRKSRAGSHVEVTPG
jgi:DNA repair protein SbcC/Rad50